ncbi:MAG: amidohydrolase [Deltaproteobacteria bacterium]|nr:amidohydrolase [Deltaproteobacteria bacterium]
MDGKEPKEELDILIEGGKLITMAEGNEIIENPRIGIAGGRIVFVESGLPESSKAYVAAEAIDARGCIVMPGLINTHTHLPMVCFRGMADDLPLMSWLNDHIFPAEARYVNRDMAYAGSLLAMAEMVLSGTTTFCDSYFFESSVAHAAMTAGMRAVVALGFIDIQVLDSPEPSRQREIAEGFINRWRNRAPLVSPALCCHSPYTCSPETLKTVEKVASKAGVPFVIHLAETKEEIHLIEERHNRTPIGHLRDLAILDEKTVAVHCNWLSEEDMDIMAAADVKVCHNPESNMKLAAGMAPVPSLIDRGIRVGLGTDGCASNNDLDMFREMGTTARIHKVIEMDPTVMDAATVLKMATIDGARVLGIDDRTGSIEPGKEADIILVDLRRPHLTPVHNCRSQLVYAASGADVTTSIIGGKIVMKDRRLLTIDVNAAMSEVRKIAAVISSDRP